jgi:hypothetical protein
MDRIFVGPLSRQRLAQASKEHYAPEKLLHPSSDDQLSQAEGK